VDVAQLWSIGSLKIEAEAGEINKSLSKLPQMKAEFPYGSAFLIFS
jgi:hypothetical protein